jgi:hypothetical protein
VTARHAGPSLRIRPALADELEAFQEIGRAAGQCFADVGVPEIADDDPLPISALDCYRRAGPACVAVDHPDQPLAYLLADRVDAGCTSSRCRSTPLRPAGHRPVRRREPARRTAAAVPGDRRGGPRSRPAPRAGSRPRRDGCLMTAGWPPHEPGLGRYESAAPPEVPLDAGSSDM